MTIFALALALTVSGCARRADESKSLGACPEQDAGRVVDPALLAFLSRARSAHHMADRYEEKKTLDRAISALETVLDGPIPGGRAPPAEAREVLADTRARLADLRSSLGRFDEASRDIELGLELATEHSYFRGHLFEVRGLLEERRAKALEAAGDSARAGDATKAALEAFEQAMRIQADVIKGALPEGDK